MTSFRYPVEDIRAKCDLAEMVSAYVTLKRSGKRLVGLCPFHGEKTPSFYVNQDTQRYKCFGCGEGGDAISFLMRIEGLTFPEAVEQLARKTGVELQRSEVEVRSAGERDRVMRVNNLATVCFRKALAASSFAQDYCRARGITDEAVERYKLGYASDGWTGLADYLGQRIDMKDAVKAGLVAARDSGDGYYDLFRNRLMFPIQDVQDRIIAFGGRALGDEPAKYINSSETPLFSKSRSLYGLNIARRAIAREDKVILVEGYLDVISAQMAGFENTVAAMGTALTRDHVILLARYTRHAVLAYDSDSAGMAAAMRSAPMFEDAGVSVRVAEIPFGEDPDSLLRGEDVAVFARILADALPLADYRLNRILDNFDLSTADGRRDALTEALPVVGEIENMLERERLITRLAQYHRVRSSGEALEESQLRREVDRLRAKRKVDKPRASLEETKSRTAEHRLSAVDKAQRGLLGILIRQPQMCERVFADLSSDQFSEGGGRILATALQELWASMGNINMGRLCESVAGTEAESVLNDIMVGLTPWEPDDAPVEDLIDTIVLHRKRQKEKRFRALADRIGRGELTRNDEEFAEYWALVRELHK